MLCSFFVTVLSEWHAKLGQLAEMCPENADASFFPISPPEVSLLAVCHVFRGDWNVLDGTEQPHRLTRGAAATVSQVMNEVSTLNYPHLWAGLLFPVRSLNKVKFFSTYHIEAWRTNSKLNGGKKASDHWQQCSIWSLNTSPLNASRKKWVTL